MIRSVEMINWRAYDHKIVDFDTGITFLMGANGIGKTSILEAIAYGLTGEPSTVSHRGKLLRDPESPATVRLMFEVDDESYLVERSQSSARAENASLTQLGVRKPLATSHKKVTEHIEYLMGVSADFLQRIVYMSEGDVFRFLDQPPGKALDMQIRQVLGLTQLDQFAQAVKSAEKEIKEKLKTAQLFMGRLDALEVRTDEDLEHRLSDTGGSRESLLADLRASQDKIARYRADHEGLNHLAPLVRQALPILRQDPDTWSLAQQEPVNSLHTTLEERLGQTVSRIGDLQVTLARSEGEQATQQRALDILLPYADSDETLPCPVCRKPMTRQERESVIQDMRNDMHRLDETRENTQQQLKGVRREADRLRKEFGAISELRNALAHGRLQSVDPQATITNLNTLIEDQQTAFQEQMTGLETQAKELEREVAQLEMRRSGFLALRREMESLGYDSIAKARQALVGLETRSLSLRAVNNAAQETLTEQRNTSIVAIYEQIAQIWQVFMGRGNWRIQLDAAGMPIIENDQGRQLDLRQFSGGEKTALLVMLHTIIARHFASSDFILIDEPLEHLDAINRRSLVRFLIGAYRKDCFKQAIIATFEESLIRKYMSDEGVHVLHLESVQA